MRDIETGNIISRYEKIQEHRKWRKELPMFNFDKEWNVQIIPPFGGAIIRFYIEHNEKWVSVYFDAYSVLGYKVDENGEPVPYFEYYDGNDIYRYDLNESKQMMADIREYLNS